MTIPSQVRAAETLLNELANAIRIEAAPTAQSMPAMSVEERYRALVEQIPAVVFFADLEQGAGSAYVSSHIEATLGFSQEEWLDDPVRWCQQIYDEDRERYSDEVARLVLTGEPLHSWYRVVNKDGDLVWYQCEARMVRRENGDPWFVHGIAFDITELKRTEAALQEERNFAAAILDTVGTLVIVLDPQMRIVRFNRVCEQTSGRSFDEVRARYLWDLVPLPEQAEQFRSALARLRAGLAAPGFESQWGSSRDPRQVSWTITAIHAQDGSIQHFIAAGSDVTARKRLEAAMLDVSVREQQRIGQDLHDGLGQLLTGIGFMSKAHESRLAESSLPEAAEAAKIVKLVNDAIRKARELARGLMPVSLEPDGLCSGLERLAREIEDVFGVECRFERGAPVYIRDGATASHLYHIAQEAAHNGIKHGKAQRIEIILSARNESGSLVVHDCGCGLQPNPVKETGMGLDIMEHRAKMIGGSLEISSNGNGTTVACHFPTL